MSLLAFNWDNQQNALSALTDQLNHSLVHCGFQRIEKRSWERDRGWITDGIYLNVKQAPTWKFDPHLIIYLPDELPEEEGGGRIIFSQANGAKYGGHDDTEIKLPKYSFFITRFVRDALSEIEQSLAWFDQFSTPKQCLAAVDRLHKPGCLVHKKSTEYLRTVI